MKFQHLIPFLSLVVMSGCNLQESTKTEVSIPTADIDVRAEINSCNRINGYNSYRWQPSTVKIENAEANWKLPGFDVDAELHALIDAQMQSKGYEKVDESGDMIIAYSAGVSFDTLNIKTEQKTLLDIFDNAPSAAMVLMLMDANCGQIIWAGRANGNLSQNADDELVKKRLAYVIKEVFSYLPGK